MPRAAWPLSLLLVAACDGGPSDPACTILIPITSTQTEVQTALIDAPEGSVVCLEEGSYQFQTELSIAKPGMTLRGAGREQTVLDFSNQDLGANGIQVTSDAVTIAKLSVWNTPGDGIRATSVRDIVFEDVLVGWSNPSSLDNGAYGLYPVGSDGVRVERAAVTGSRDAGIYVGQSTRILVKDSEVWGNVAGIELENSTDGEVVGCHAHDNTGGILVFNLPGLPVQDGKRAKVHGNLIENNNLPNFAEAGTVVAVVPRGTGLLLLSSDNNEFHDNVIRGNGSMGILLLSYVEALLGTTDDPSFDAYPQGNYVHDNVFENNGGDPEDIVASVADAKPVADILWDGCIDPELGLEATPLNCLRDNGGARYENLDFCLDFGASSTDAAPVTCDYPTLGGQDP